MLYILLLHCSDNYDIYDSCFSFPLKNIADWNATIPFLYCDTSLIVSGL